MEREEKEYIYLRRTLIAFFIFAFSLANVFQISDFIHWVIAESRLDQWQKFATSMQGFAVTVGVALTLYLFIWDRYKRRNDRTQQELSLLTVKTSGRLFPRDNRSTFIVHLESENVGLRSVKLWGAELVDAHSLCEDSPTEAEIRTAMTAPLTQDLKFWEKPTFAIRTGETHTDSIIGTFPKKIGPFAFKVRIFFDHEGKDHSGWRIHHN